MVMTIEKINKNAAILKLCIICTKYLMCINTDVLKSKFLAQVIWPGWLCTDDDNDNDANDTKDYDNRTIAIGSFRLMPNEPKSTQRATQATQ